MRVALIAGGILLLLIDYALMVRLRSSVTLVAGRGGLWLRFVGGLSGLPRLGMQLRWQMGHMPRVWLLALGRAWPVSPFTWKPAWRHKAVRPVRHRVRLRGGLRLPIRTVRNIMRRTEIECFDVRIALGVADDAAATALLCATLACAAQGARSALSRGGRPLGSVYVRPVFTGGRLSARFSCISSVKVRHIIWELMKAYALKEDHHGNASD